MIRCNYLKRIVNIESEVAHDRQMVPELAHIFVDIARLREQRLHHIHDGVGATCALISVSNGQAIIYHLLDIASIFRQTKLGATGVIA